MPIRLTRLVFLPVILLLSASPCLADLDTTARIKVVATNYPLAYFAERIAGTRASVSLPVSSGEDPAFWRPDKRAVTEMQKADLILFNGAGYEKWLGHVTLPRLKTVVTSAAFKSAYLVIENAVTHSHGPAGTHSHEGIAFTTWLDFQQAGQQADAVAQALIRKRPELKASFLDKLAGLQADLKALDSQLQQLVASQPNRPLFASHPVYQYLARRYGLNLLAVHWEPNEMPPDEEWKRFDAFVPTHPARWMLWEGQPDMAIAAKLKQRGIDSLVFDPCGNRPEAGDFIDVMKQNLENLQRALR